MAIKDNKQKCCCGLTPKTAAFTYFIEWLISATDGSVWVRNPVVAGACKNFSQTYLWVPG